MNKWKRLGIIVVQYAFDHPPKHVHVFEDGKRLLKFNLEAWKVMGGRLTPKARKVLEMLREEGKFHA